MSRDPFAFLGDLSRDAVLLTILQAVIKKSGGEVRLEPADLMAIDPGDAMLKYLSDKGDELIVRFARKGAEAYFVPEDSSSKTEKSRSNRIAMPRQETVDVEQPSRHAVHDDLDLALREEQIINRSNAAQKKRVQEARAQSGMPPWTTRPS